MLRLKTPPLYLTMTCTNGKRNNQLIGVKDLISKFQRLKLVLKIQVKLESKKILQFKQK